MSPLPIPELPPSLQRLVVKDGVALGGLSTDDRLQALAWIWAGLPVGLVATEPQVNEALKAQLAGPGRFIDVDHVELRRWLVDGGWLQRDGYGREYRRSQPTDAAAAAWAERLAHVDTAACAQAWRAEREAERRARRARWQAQGGVPSGGQGGAAA
ncbi:DUF2087 domain-containing protein [Rubrivivax rivuli]|uniref:DUF2087 domain-containing protein n=1 Tax=Rubrivivax rivuli TaxID=1862385 RepID=A0A437RHE9_9BURK|nr:DUF2087 domain-containing protein [Rubrivivax rivuli]RVU46207.1 DUF2087 domain-containing protein [Rubrivivax rivuli]